MKHVKITFLIVVAFAISIYSITTSYSILVDREDGVALEKIDVYKVDLNINDSVTSSENISFLNDPILEENTLSFSIGLDTVGSFGQIYFDINNIGDYDAILKNIEVSGLEEYQDFVDVSLVGIKEGDKIESGSLIKNASIKISCVNDYENEILLNNIGIKINLEKI